MRPLWWNVGWLISHTVHGVVLLGLFFFSEIFVARVLHVGTNKTVLGSLILQLQT